MLVPLGAKPIFCLATPCIFILSSWNNKFVVENFHTKGLNLMRNLSTTKIKVAVLFRQLAGYTLRNNKMLKPKKTIPGYSAVFCLFTSEPT